jgi:hypothetical protein
MIYCSIQSKTRYDYKCDAKRREGHCVAAQRC